MSWDPLGREPSPVLPFPPRCKINRIAPLAGIMEDVDVGNVTQHTESL